MSAALLSIDHDDECCVEVWDGDRKITVYFPASAITSILKIHADNIDDGNPADLREAMSWLRAKESATTTTTGAAEKGPGT